MAVKADQFNPQLLLFQAHRRREQLAKHNAKDDARPKAKAAYHLMDISWMNWKTTRMKRVVQMKKLTCPTIKRTVTVTTRMCIILCMYLHCN